MVLTGDISQSDLHRSMRGGFIDLINALSGVDQIGVAQLFNQDIIRNPIIGKILSRLESYENESAQQ
jgi:phosphate starvation-inducible PhoH-like protein